jgi:hypothetical protein
MQKTNRYWLAVFLMVALTACSQEQAVSTIPTKFTSAITQTYSTAIPSENYTPTSTQTITFTSTLTTTPEPTQVPTLEAQTWVTDNPLVMSYGSSGDGCCQHPWPPEFVLYSDGQLFIWAQTEQGSQLLTKQLARQEVCAFLNTVDQLGFYDYNQETYQIDRYGQKIEYFSIEGSNTQHISINAWRSNAVSLYGLRSYLNADPSIFDLPKGSFFQSPIILPALKNTFLLITSYMPSDMEIFQPEFLEVWLIGSEISGENTRTWPVEEPSLEYLINNAQADESYNNWTGQSSRKIVLAGSTAREVFDLFSQKLDSQVFTDGKNTVEIIALPVLPYTDGYEESPTPSSMHCAPSDGQVTWKQ